MGGTLKILQLFKDTSMDCYHENMSWSVIGLSTIFSDGWAFLS
ncbi:hypothetical protein DSUL_90101 [Desulfovibrionales bacterium]